MVTEEEPNGNHEAAGRGDSAGTVRGVLDGLQCRRLLRLPRVRIAVEAQGVDGQSAHCGAGRNDERL